MLQADSSAALDKASYCLIDDRFDSIRSMRICDVVYVCVSYTREHDARESANILKSFWTLNVGYTGYTCSVAVEARSKHSSWSSRKHWLYVAFRQQMRRLPKLQPFVKVYKARNSRSMQLAVALLHVCVAFARHRQTNAGQHSDAKIELESVSISSNCHLARIIAYLSLLSFHAEANSTLHLWDICALLALYQCVKGCSSQSDLVLLDEGLFPPHIAARYGQRIRKFPQYQPPVEVTARLRDSPGLKKPNPRQGEDWKHVLSCTPLRSWPLMKCQLIYKKCLA